MIAGLIMRVAHIDSSFDDSGWKMFALWRHYFENFF